MDKLKPQRTRTYDRTIRGSLTKRRELHHEAEQAQPAALARELMRVNHDQMSERFMTMPGMVK